MARKKVKRAEKVKTITGTGSGSITTYDSMLEFFSPAVAKEILDKYNTHNRTLPRVAAKRYAGDMKNDRWGKCADPIKFSSIGAIVPGERTLLGGQTRLVGVIESRKGQSFPVVYDVPVECQKVDDRGQQRQFRETITLFDGVSKKMASILEKATRRMLYGSDSRPSASHAELEAFRNEHREALDFVVNVFPKYQKNITTAPVLGAVGRAWYYVDDKDLLVRFAEILKTGERIVPKERAAKKIREWLMSREYKGGGQQSINAFLIVQVAIEYFIRGTSGRRKLFPVPKDDPFPLPGAWRRIIT